MKARVARATADELAAMTEIEWILRGGVDSRITPDQTAAIVGHTGAGKTTMISLMMRFYDVQRGQVLVDGVDVREHDLLKLRRHFGGGAAGSVAVYAGRLRAISGWARSGSRTTQMRLAAEQVNVHDFIASLPGGFR